MKIKEKLLAGGGLALFLVMTWFLWTLEAPIQHFIN